MARIRTFPKITIHPPSELIEMDMGPHECAECGKSTDATQWVYVISGSLEDQMYRIHDDCLNSNIAALLDERG